MYSHRLILPFFESISRLSLSILGKLWSRKAADSVENGGGQSGGSRPHIYPSGVKRDTLGIPVDLPQSGLEFPCTNELIFN